MIRKMGMTGPGGGGRVSADGLLAQFDCVRGDEAQVVYDRSYHGPRRNQVVHSADMSYWETYRASAPGGGQIAFQAYPDAAAQCLPRCAGYAGPASMRLEARLAAGAGAFRFWLGSYSPDFALTEDWQEFSWSATVPEGAAWGIVNGSDGAARTIEVRQVYGEAAASPGSHEDAPFDATLGVTYGAEDYDPAWTERGLDYGNARKFVRFLKPMTLATSTLYVLAKWNGTQFGGYSTLVGASNPDGWDFGLHGSYVDGTMWPRYALSGTAFAEAQGVNLNDGAWHVLAATHDGASIRMYLDGVETAAKSVGPAALTVAGLLIGGHTGANKDPNGWMSWPGEIAYLLAYDVSHTAGEIGRTTKFLFQEARRRGIAAGRPKIFVVVDGDSFSETSIGVPYGEKWPYLALRGLAQHRNFAVGGRRLDQMLSLGPSTTFLLGNAATDKNVFLFWGGPNDMADGADAVYGRMQALADGARGAGYQRVVSLNFLPKHSDPAYNSTRCAVNEMLAADHRFLDALVDIAADPVMGLEATTGDTTYYSDGWHPAPAGHTLIAQRVGPVLAAIIQG